MSTALTFAERMQHAGTGTVIGVATVFAILMILWLILAIMQFVFSSTNKENKKKVKVQAVPETVASAPVAKTDDTQLIAVITAAITAMFEAQGITTKFRVKSFRRTK